MTIQVKIAQLPGGAVQTIDLPEGSTVHTAFSSKGITISTEESVAVNAAPAAADTPLKNGDVVTSSRAARGAN